MTERLNQMEGPYITFVLGREEYGIPFEKVHEILGPDGILEMDEKTPCMKGVMKLRNQRMPILDLSCHFGVGQNVVKGGGAVLVTVMGEGGMVGLFVDAIRQVLHVQANCLKPSIIAQEDPRADFVVGAAHIQGRVISLLNFDRGMELLPQLAAFTD